MDCTSPSPPGRPLEPAPTRPASGHLCDSHTLRCLRQRYRSRRRCLSLLSPPGRSLVAMGCPALNRSIEAARTLGPELRLSLRPESGAGFVPLQPARNICGQAADLPLPYLYTSTTAT